MASRYDATVTIYAVASDLVGIVKIGSTSNLRLRLRAIARELNAPDLRVLATCPGSRRQEFWLHRKLSASATYQRIGTTRAGRRGRRCGWVPVETYQPTPEVAAAVRSIAATTVGGRSRRAA